MCGTITGGFLGCMIRLPFLGKFAKSVAHPRLTLAFVTAVLSMTAAACTLFYTPPVPPEPGGVDQTVEVPVPPEPGGVDQTVEVPVPPQPEGVRGPDSGSSSAAAVPVPPGRRGPDSGSSSAAGSASRGSDSGSS